jgi:hypothetical protein
MPARSFPTQSYRNSVSSGVCNRTCKRTVLKKLDKQSLVGLNEFDNLVGRALNSFGVASESRSNCPRCVSHVFMFGSRQRKTAFSRFLAFHSVNLQGPLRVRFDPFATPSADDRYLRDADNSAGGRELAARNGRLLQPTAAASSLSHARKACTLGDALRLFAQTKQ